MMLSVSKAIQEESSNAACDDEEVVTRAVLLWVQEIKIPLI